MTPAEPKIFRRILSGILCLAAAVSCARRSAAPASEIPESGNAVYYWRTVFAPDSTELAFLRRHAVDRIYLRMFDIAVESDPATLQDEAVPIATTRFVAEIPDGVEIVPTVYITLDALRAMFGREAEYAGLIVERLRAMAAYNRCGEVQEMQFDCDWTASTRGSYAALCRAAGEMLHRDGIRLSATIRLHQLSEDAPPVDCGVLMLYNTGALKNPVTRNSILDLADVLPYLRHRRCDLPLDYVYPAFGWGVRFRNGEFRGIVSHPEKEQPEAGDTVRIERPTASEVLAVKERVESALGRPAYRRILYHLDQEQLNCYTDDEIATIYADR